MKKSLAIALVSAFVLSATAGAMAANSSNSDNKVVAGAKKVGNAIVWPFKKVGEGTKNAWKKVTGK
ncbi:MAG TPA: hypothetical protein V6D22_11385 [Candidatus Obscuribacterales bacterium]